MIGLILTLWGIASIGAGVLIGLGIRRADRGSQRRVEQDQTDPMDDYSIDWP